MSFPTEARRCPVSLLAVGLDAKDADVLTGVTNRARWKLYSVRTYREALNMLYRQSVPAILCRSSLPDGDWKDVLSQIAPLSEAPELIVVSPAAADLRHEVRDLGGYDTLPVPLETRTLVRVVARASHNWRRRLAGALPRKRNSQKTAAAPDFSF